MVRYSWVLREKVTASMRKLPVDRHRVPNNIACHVDGSVSTEQLDFTTVILLAGKFRWNIPGGF